MNMKSLVIEPQ